MEKTRTVRCGYCGSMYEQKTSLENFKNLWRKPTWNEWFVLVIIVIAIIAAFFYYNEMKSSMYLRNNFPEVCQKYMESKLKETNYSDLTLKGMVDNFSGKLKEVEDKLNSIEFYPNETKTSNP